MKGGAWKGLDYIPIPGATNLTKMDARIMEQTIINHLGKGTNGGKLLNQANSVAESKWMLYGIP